MRYLKLSQFLEKSAFFIKSFLMILMGVTTLFIDKTNPLYHWTWILYWICTILLCLIDWNDHNNKNKKPIDRIKEYLYDFNGWRSAGDENYTFYYEPAPEYTIRTRDADNHIDYQQEWTRGEIGSHYKSGNAAYYREIYFHNNLLHKIHIVTFDGGKKTIVAPDWKPIGRGRIYFYMKNSIEYAYQQFLEKESGKDDSKYITKSATSGQFDIPVFKNEEKLQNFIDFCGGHQNEDPETNQEQQNIIFYSLLERLEKFQKTKGKPLKEKP